jgi:propane monooxygenase reductase subunit
MNLFSATITHKEKAVDNSFIIRLKPIATKTVFTFEPGQYCLLQNPFTQDKRDLRPFSIASSPEVKHALEFCIKIYGDWTKSFSHIKEGDAIQLTGPFGNFIWNDAINNAVFLVGGTGIAPIMSMLRTITARRRNPHIKLLYGNRTPETILYKEELDRLQKDVSNFQLVNIFSEYNEEEKSYGPYYHGFISTDIVKKEVDFSGKPIFFVIGPPIFIEKMNILLAEFQVKPEQIIQENLKLPTQTSRTKIER